MSDKPRNYNNDLASIMNAIAESTHDMTDEEIESEIREEGGDPDAIAGRVQDVLRAAVKSCRQRPLLEAQKQYEERVAELRVKKYQIPDSLDEQRKMIGVLLTANPQFSSGLLTAQFREFKELPDEEVEPCLRQLLELTETTDAADSEEE